ncbi:Oxidoreductase [Agyrium rufum]|nr:Oxidoreductase [Agyrium rufum]
MSTSQFYRSAPRALLRHSTALPIRSTARRRFINTAPPAQKSRSWKSSAARWGVAIAGIYYYNTSNVFAEEVPFAIPDARSSAHEDNDASLPTLESLSPSSRQERATSNSALKTASSSSSSTIDPLTPSPLLSPPETPMSEIEEEASQQGAFNEETGEINWDCSCLGGMAYGPCGEEFRAAFSCFVYSKEEPKGMECIEQFKGMQTCFRAHPDVYGAELDEDEEAAENPDSQSAGLSSDGQPISTSAAVDVTSSETPNEYSQSATSATSLNSEESTSSKSPTGGSATERANQAKEQVDSDHGIQSETDELVPKAAHDAS